MANRIFKADFLRNELDLPYNSDIVIKDEIADNSRWSIIHDIIFKFENKFYRASYRVGATEEQDESPWEYEEDVDCIEVHQVEKVVKVWEAL